MPKIIKYYRTSQYGQVREFVHSDNADFDFDLRQLTNQKTIDLRIRNTISRMTDNQIQFQEVIAPLK